MLPKVLVGCPTSNHKEYCLDKYVKGLKSLTYKNFDILIVDNSEDESYYEKIKSYDLPVKKLDKNYELARFRLSESRNMIRKEVLEGDYDYFFSLEQDVVPPVDVIERLLSYKKLIISGVYYNKIKDTYPPGLKPLLWRTATKEELDFILSTDDPMYDSIKKQIEIEGVREGSKIRARFTVEELEKPKLVEIYMAGLGCVLIQRDVLKKIKFKSSMDRQSFDDVQFYEDARKLKYPLYADTSIKCKHYIMKWNSIKM